MRFNKVLTTLALLPALVLAGPLSACAATPSSSTMFNVKSGNQQGLATDGHKVWVSFDVGSGKSKIATYTWKGKYIGTSKALALGHAAEVDYRVKNNSLYATNGGLEKESTSADTKVYRVTLNSKGIAQKVVQTYHFEWLGRNGLVAVDNKHDKIVTMGGPDAGPWTVTIHEFEHAAKSSALSTFEVNDPGVLLQGLAYVNGVVWVYVSEGAVNRIDKFSTDGTLLSCTTLPYTGEAEGIAINPITGSVYTGAHSPNRVIRVSGIK